MSLMAFALVIGMLGTGAFAYFSDTETSSGNTFTAGTLDLKVYDPDADEFVDDDELGNINDYWNELVNNLKPGDSDTIIIPVKNAGTIPGTADIHIKDVVNYENGQNDAEAAVDLSTGDLDGELGGVIQVQILYGDGVNPPVLVASGTLNDLNCKNFNALVPLAADGTAVWIINMSIDGPGVGNEIQSDSVVCDVEFSLNQ